mgnify:CR=1 FL=1
MAIDLITVIVVVASLATAFLSSIFGMLGGLILMGILVSLMKVGPAMILHGLIQMTSNGYRAWLNRKDINWKTVGTLFIGNVLAMVILFFIVLGCILAIPLMFVADERIGSIRMVPRLLAFSLVPILFWGMKSIEYTMSKIEVRTSEKTYIFLAFPSLGCAKLSKTTVNSIDRNDPCVSLRGASFVMEWMLTIGEVDRRGE